MTDSFTQVARFDRGAVTKAVMTKEGFLKADAIVTRVGIFEYINQDGSIRYELRHPEDVLKADSLESMKMLPITNGHPPQKLVTAENAKSLQVGHTGETIKADGNFVITSLKVTDANTIKDIKSGKRQELSLGYLVDVIQEDGTYQGQKYTHRQTNIKYNHLAVVDRARAGSDARIHLDSNDAQEKESLSNDYRHFKERNMSEDMKLSNVTLDGIDYKASPEVVNALKKATLKADEAQVKLDALTAEKEKLKAEKDSLTEKLEAANKVNLDEKIQEGVKARVALIENIKKIMGDKVDEIKLDGVSDKEIKSLVVKAKCPKVDVVASPEAYIQARFDTLLEDALEQPMIETRKQATPSQDAKNDSAASAEEARKKMIAEMTKRDA